MDFVEGLPLSKSKSTILVVVDKLTKYGHFLTLAHLYTVYKLHRTSATIVSDRDKVFLSRFWQELFKCLGIKLHLSTTYHPQTNDQTKILSYPYPIGTLDLIQ
ncbi:reverse transcriptase [Gossypium australe]|uniref:Reverse transcriptase n=1 Tax=Gossypium australe TaxID=47621 RepID=A0A5B6VIK3_9ROSI|nr:reverse transcriptase [Gossypium australe]